MIRVMWQMLLQHLYLICLLSINFVHIPYGIHVTSHIVGDSTAHASRCVARYVRCVRTLDSVEMQ